MADLIVLLIVVCIVLMCAIYPVYDLQKVLKKLRIEHQRDIAFARTQAEHWHMLSTCCWIYLSEDEKLEVLKRAQQWEKIALDTLK